MRQLTLAAAALGLSAAPIAAQNPCAAITILDGARQACQTATDGLRAFHPRAGVLVSGGNPVLGTAATRGGFPHVALSLRANLVRVSLPDPASILLPPVPSSFDGIVPAPVVEAAVGLYRGVGRGLLSVDGLASASLLPTGAVPSLAVDPDAASLGDMALGLGYGVRVGILQGSLVVPSVSVSVMRRHLPRLQYGDLSAGEAFEFAADLDATNLRAVASLRLLTLDVAAGVGWDKYTTAASVAVNELIDPTAPPTRREILLDLDTSRTLLFVDATFHLAVVQFVGEIGYLSGTDEMVATQFRDFDPTGGSVFGTLGIRVGF